MKHVRFAGKDALDYLEEKLRKTINGPYDENTIDGFMIPAGAFIQNTDENALYYPYCYDQAIEGMNSKCFVEAIYTPASVALNCMAPHVISMDGAIRFYAYEAPSANIEIEILFWKEVGSDDTGD